MHLFEMKSIQLEFKNTYLNMFILCNFFINNKFLIEIVFYKPLQFKIPKQLCLVFQLNMILNLNKICQLSYCLHFNINIYIYIFFIYSNKFETKNIVQPNNYLEQEKYIIIFILKYES